jgi:hypothetical protein
MWTPVPPVPAPMGMTGAPVAASMFGAPGLSGAASGLSIGPQPVPGMVPAQAFGYGSVMTPPLLFTSGPVPFAPQPASVLVNSFGGDATAGVPVPVLLTAIAVRRGQPQGPTTDQEIEEFVYDAFELLAGAGDVEVRCEGGRTTLTGTVQHKRVKRDIGEILWAIPGVSDVQNSVTIASRRRARAANRDVEPMPAPQSRKQA